MANSNAGASGEFKIGGERTIHRLGFGAMPDAEFAALDHAGAAHAKAQ